MRAREFIREESEPTMNQFNQFLQDCSEYFQYVRNPHLVLLRGDNRPGNRDTFQPIERSMAGGRAPSDTHYAIHDIFNDLFQAKFGHPFRNSMMASGSESQAKSYGPVSIIIPANGYTLCYSPVYDDMFANAAGIEVSDIATKLDWEDPNDSEGNYKPLYTQLRKAVKRAFDYGNYKSGPDKITAAIQSNHEVMLYPSSGSTLTYYSFTESFWHSIVIPELERRRM